MFTVLPYLYGENFIETLKTNIIFLIIDSLGVYFILYFLMPKYLYKNKYLRFFAGILCIYLAIFIISIGLKKYVLYHFLPDVELQPLAYEIYLTISIFSFIAGLAILIKLIKRYYLLSIEKKEIEKKNIQAELKALTSQVNPHFIFNVLNNIDEMMYENREKASEYIYSLSKIMRYMLEEYDNKIMLKTELDYIKNFLDLSAFSYQEKDFIQFKIKGEIKNIAIPPKLFIPLIENTIKHSNKKGALKGIFITFEINDNNIILYTKNYCKQNPVKSNRKALGINNLEQRLKLLYDENYELIIEKNDSTFETFLKIPINNTKL